MAKEIKATKSAKELAQEHGIDLADVPASGDKITAEDVQSYMAGIEAAKEKPSEDAETGEGDPTDETAQQKEPEAAKEEAPQPEAEKSLVCVYRIKEDGTVTDPGQPYTGKRAEEFLASGAIKYV